MQNKNLLKRQEAEADSFDHELPGPLDQNSDYASSVPTRNHIHTMVRTPTEMITAKTCSGNISRLTGTKLPRRVSSSMCRILQLTQLLVRTKND